MPPAGWELRRIAKELPIAVLLRAHRDLNEALTRWRYTTRHADRDEPAEVSVAMRKASALLDEALNWLRRTSTDAAAYAAVVDGHATTVAAPIRAGPDRPGSSTSAEPATHRDSTAAAPEPTGGLGFDPRPYLELLPRVPARHGPGETRLPTRGLWVKDDSKRETEDLASGKWDLHDPSVGKRKYDPYYLKAVQHAFALGLVDSKKKVPSAVVDVELKFAMRMRDEGIKRATIVINREPCKGRHGCDTLLPRFLPSGAVLTVCWPGGCETYPKGGER